VSEAAQLLHPLQGVLQGPMLYRYCTAAPPLQYRTLKNYKSPDYLGPRVADKLIFS
jgi:hypothetical protein